MKKGLAKRLIKFIFKLIVPIIGIWCVVEYWKAELIVDKIHYGMFMLAMLIITIDNTHNNSGGKMAAN